VPPGARFLIRRLETLVIEAADEVILPSEGRRAQIEPARPRRLTVVENSPDLTLLPAKRLATSDLAYVGILARGRLLEEVATRLAGQSRATLRIAGFGPLADEIANVAAESPSVEFMGKATPEEALQIMCSARIMFATYDPAIRNHQFSAPNKLAEAMALGKPLIVCRGTSIDEEVEQSGLGRVIDYDADEFVRVLAEMLEDPELLTWCAAEGPRIYQSSHSWPVNAARLDEVYYRTVTTGRGARES
jgi:glycosyltransferase involved in cell wall biosynthesis